jgi:predicted dehydrogenase
MIRCAVIGAGHLGRYHGQKYAKSQAAELVAVCDVNIEKASSLAAELGCKAVYDYKQLAALQVHAASVATDTAVHYEITRWLLSNGIDVLVEKPITRTTAEARELIEMAKALGRILQAGHLERFNPAFRSMRKHLSAPRFFEVRRIAQFTGRSTDVDVIRDLMIHDIDLVAHLVGRPIQKVDAVGVPVITSSVDVANARLTFDNGAVANITSSRAAFKAERTIRIFQPDLYISLDFVAKKLKIVRKEGSIDEKGFSAIKMEELPVDEGDALEAEINSFVSSVATRSKPEVPGEDGLRALELAETIAAALAENDALASPAKSAANLWWG